MQYPPWAQQPDASAAGQPPAQDLAAPGAVPDDSLAPSAPPAEAEAAPAGSGSADHAASSSSSAPPPPPLSWAQRLGKEQQHQEQPRAHAAGRTSSAGAAAPPGPSISNGADSGDFPALGEPAQMSNAELDDLALAEAIKNSLQDEEVNRYGFVPLQSDPLPCSKQNTFTLTYISDVAAQITRQCPGHREAQCTSNGKIEQ